MKNITISEYGYIGCDRESTFGDKFVGFRDLSPSDFKELKEYWESNEETFKLFTLHNKNCLKATSLVGIVQTKSISIEILPKIYKNQENKEDIKANYRYLFIEMLKPLLNINDIQINKANLSITKNKKIYEIFITMFVDHVDKLIHRGLKSQYIVREDNQFFLKGKLKFNQHIKQNYIHKERFFVEFDEFLQDRVENRLLKSTIELLLNKTNDFENKRALRQQLFIFDEVLLSNNYDIDFTKINTHRGMEYYAIPLRLAKVFLKHQSFTSLRGKDNVFALLFPMEKVFEKYMEFVLNNSKENLNIKKVCVNGYSGDYLLSRDIINQQPDYLLEMKDNKKSIITDAKWKLFDITENIQGGKINISSGDVYQIFSYLHYYDSQKTAYIFAPNTVDFNDTRNLTEPLKYLKRKDIETDKAIRIIPIDLNELTKNHILEKVFYDKE